MGTYHGTKDIKKMHYRMRYELTTDKKREILEEVFKRRVGYPLNLDNPQTMNEKIMWLKLYYQDPLITTCSDKFAVKDYVAKVAGKKYIVPTIKSWSRAEDIDLSVLPDRFALKVNWSSGYNIIVKDKSALNEQQVKEKIKRWMQPDRNSYYQYFNWGYKHMKPVVYAEEYIEQVAGQVYDYKLFICGGKFKYMFIAKDRSNDDTLTYDFFDADFNNLPFQYAGGKHANPLPEKPKHFEEMIQVAEKLAAPFPFCRVDFYEIGDQIYIGEMTFYSGGGLLPMNPVEYDYKLGALIPLPEKRIIDTETRADQFMAACIKTCRSARYKMTAIRKKVVHKDGYKNNKYLCVGPVRIPYTTHSEYSNGYARRYCSMLGLEICYKKTPSTPRSSLNSDLPFDYQLNTTKHNFMMEDKITPQIQRIHCEQKAYKQLGYFPNLKNPKSFNEKIIWLALHYKNPEIAPATDKGKAKTWISDRVGSEHVVPLIGVYSDVNDIDFAALPDRFVAKLNDGWGAEKVMIIRDKSKINIDKTKAVLSSWLYPWNNYYYQNMCITDEKMDETTIVIEEYIEQEGHQELEDFKFYCCNGEPKLALVVAGRGTASQTRAFVDMDWKVLPVARQGKNIPDTVSHPQNLEKMMELARKLSSGFPFVRIDFYESNNQVFVGEMTFTPGMFLKFSSRLWDDRLGEYIQLPELPNPAADH